MAALSKLGPRIRKRLASSPDATPIRLLLEIAPATDRTSLTAALQHAGAIVQSWSDEGRFATIVIAPDRIGQLSALTDVNFIEAPDTYRD